MTCAWFFLIARLRSPKKKMARKWPLYCRLALMKVLRDAEYEENSDCVLPVNVSLVILQSSEIMTSHYFREEHWYWVRCCCELKPYFNFNGLQLEKQGRLFAICKGTEALVRQARWISRVREKVRDLAHCSRSAVASRLPQVTWKNARKIRSPKGSLRLGERTVSFILHV